MGATSTDTETAKKKPRRRLKLVIAGFLLLILGILVGGLGVASYTGYQVSNSVTLGYWGCQDYWSDEVWKAYEEEDPRVAIWALKTHIGVVRRHVDLWGDKDPDQAEIMLRDIVMMHVQLAFLHEKVGDDKAYNQNVTMAFALVEKVCPDRYESEQDLVESVEKYKCGVCAGKSEKK